jgi:putative ABC transport system permease protein
MRVPIARGWSLQETFRIEGDARTRTMPLHVVDEGYFSAMAIPLLAGRAFGPIGGTPEDHVIISRSAAATLFSDASGAAAIGKRLIRASGGPSYTIVGVVGDVREQDLAEPPTAMVYRPQAVPVHAREPGARHLMALVVKAPGSSPALVPAIRGIVRDLDPSVPIFNVETMDDVIRASTARLTLTLTLITAAAVITLLLGAVGLYGVMAYMVALRTREFGVRVALGANPVDIAGLVLTRGLILTASGIVAGFALYALAAPFLRALLFEVTPTDPATLAAATAILVVTAGLASWLPARRAARIDPAEALRAA